MNTLVLPGRYPPKTRRGATSPDQVIDLDQLAGLVTTSGEICERRTVRMPFTGEPLGTVPVCTAEDVYEAVARARAAQRLWARRTFKERRAVLLRYHDLILQHQETLLDLLQLEGGKARLHALEEVVDVAITSRHYGFHASKYLKSRRRKGALPLLTSAWEYYHPVGVVGIISPWNYPLTLTMSDAIPALMAGNSVVLKPAEEAPFTALYALQLLREAGLPQQVFQVVTGSGSLVGSALIESVDFLNFTGGAATGRVVAAQAAKRLIGVSLELGGKNPAIVLADADLDRAVAGVIRAGFSNAGQLCLSLERIYIHRTVYDRFLDSFVPKVKALRLGSALDFSADVGSLMSQAQLDKVIDHVQDALDRGAALLAGGRPRPDLGPYFYEPTILANVTPDMKVYAEETFGPVVSLYPFDHVNEAIRQANDTRYGLNAAIWTGNAREGRRIARKIRAGTVNINEGYAATWASIDAPMGGMKESGLGRRHGAAGILRYTEPQTIATQRLLPLAQPPWLKPAWFALIITLLLLLIKRIPGWR